MQIIISLYGNGYWFDESVPSILLTIVSVYELRSILTNASKMFVTVVPMIMFLWVSFRHIVCIERDRNITISVQKETDLRQAVKREGEFKCLVIQLHKSTWIANSADNGNNLCQKRTFLLHLLTFITVLFKIMISRVALLSMAPFSILLCWQVYTWIMMFEGFCISRYWIFVVV